MTNIEPPSPFCAHSSYTVSNETTNIFHSKPGGLETADIGWGTVMVPSISQFFFNS
jgi:hypothetical protein